MIELHLQEGGGPVTGKKPFRTKTVSISEYHIAPVQSALVRYLAETQNVHHILRICQQRELTRTERYQLPGHMQKMTREELAEQVDSWGSLRISIEDWLERFSFDEDPNAQLRPRALSNLT